MAAAVLADEGVDVTLLEAGPVSACRGLTARVGGMTVARWHRPLLARTDGVVATSDPDAVMYEDLAPGGLTNHWSCAVPRFAPEDFLDAQRAGAALEWPIGYSDLAPWYDRVEPLLHIAGTPDDVPLLPAGKVRHPWRLPAMWAAVAREARREGRSLVPLPYAFGASTTLTFSGTVFNSFVRVVKPALRSRRLTVCAGARALRLEWSGRSKRVEAVLFRHAGTGAEHRLPCRAVVVAAGAVNSARLLLESTSADFPDGLGNTHGILGRYLHDHPLGKVELELASPIPVHPPAYLTRASLHHSAPLYTAACVQWSGTGAVVRSVLRGHPGRLCRIGFNIFGTMVPSEADFVSLDHSRQRPDGASTLLLNVRHPPESARALVASRDLLLQLLERAGLRPRLRSWRVERAGTSVHYGGTCRMHAPLRAQRGRR
jgi:choline dehydrogenase-like flavoprotein